MKDLLIVFSNYNGMRTCNDYNVPRIQACLDSFLKYYSKEDYDALLLDNNSSDQSDLILDKYASESWTVRKKKGEDYYLGTLCHLAREFANEYKYLMIVDNDQYFIRGLFLDSAMKIMNNHEEIVCFHLFEPTIADALDHKREEKMIVSISDYVGFFNNELYMLSAKFSGHEPWYTSVREEKGSGIIAIKGCPVKRSCWLSYGYLNSVIKTEVVNDIFNNNEKMTLPFNRNSDRLAVFSSAVGKMGRTANFSQGASINIGFRKYLPSTYSVKNLIKKYELGHNSMWSTDAFSFFTKDGHLSSIEKEIERVKHDKN